jgi:hypothetical protein
MSGVVERVILLGFALRDMGFGGYYCFLTFLPPIEI